MHLCIYHIKLLGLISCSLDEYLKPIQFKSDCSYGLMKIENRLLSFFGEGILKLSICSDLVGIRWRYTHV